MSWLDWVIAIFGFFGFSFALTYLTYTVWLLRKKTQAPTSPEVQATQNSFESIMTNLGFLDPIQDCIELTNGGSLKWFELETPKSHQFDAKLSENISVRVSKTCGDVLSKNQPAKHYRIYMMSFSDKSERFPEEVNLYFDDRDNAGDVRIKELFHLLSNQVTPKPQ